VQCPLCSGEYSLGEILASAPPALIIVHSGSAGATAQGAAATVPAGEWVPAAAAAATVAPAPESTEGNVFSAHRVEPTLHDAEPLMFESDDVQLATPGGDVESFGQEDPQHAGEAAVFGAGPEAAEETDHPIEPLGEPFGEPVAEPLSEESHDPAAAPAEGDAPWGGDWGEFKEEAAHEDDGAVGLAEPDEDEDLENVDFAAITGKAAPGSALAASPGDVAEPAKKKKRKREANPLLRIVGIIFFGLLALPCVYGIAVWRGVKIDLPTWLQFNLNKPGIRADSPKPGGQANPPANGQTPAANANPTPANATPPTPVAGNVSQASGADHSQPAIGNASVDHPSPGKGPDQSPVATNPSGQTPAPGSQTATTQPAGKEPGEGQGGIPPGETKPGPTPDKPAAPNAGKGTEVAMNEPSKEAAKPATPPRAKGSDEPDPFGGSTDTKPEVKPDIPAPSKPEKPAKPDVPAAEKPESAAKPEVDPFGPAPAVAPVNEKGKTDTKPEVKPDTKPDIPAPEKAESAPKSEPDPFGPAPAVAPVNDKSKADTKFEVPVPVKPELPGKPETPEPGTNPSKTADLKPDTSPAIRPEPKPEVKPAAGLGPLQAPSFPAADLDASLKAVSGIAPVDAKSYADWCKLAEVVTYVKGGTDLQKQALRTLTEKVASSPQAASAIAAAAKKLLDEKATKGGIVLVGTVTGAGSQNGLCGTVVSMEGMAKVRIFSAHPLGVKEDQKVIVLGALVADPATNLPGYPGKQPLIVWADFATAIP
jgi:hypothetical protein